MKNILIINTGGTISSTPTETGLKPTQTATALQELFNQTQTTNFEVHDIFSLDSANISPAHWRILAEFIADKIPFYDGIVILHGTDTMSYTASALTFMLQNPPIPIVFTGSQRPFSAPLSDAPANVALALAMAESETAGIFIAFNNKIMLGCRSFKMHSTDFNAFTCPNYPLIGTATASGLALHPEHLPQQTGAFSLNTNHDDRVFLLTATPALHSNIFDFIAENNYKALIIATMGMGGIPANPEIIQGIQRLCHQNIVVAAATHCPFGTGDIKTYETGVLLAEAGAISLGDMTAPCALAKTIWALGQSPKPEIIKNILLTNYANEITL